MKEKRILILAVALLVAAMVGGAVAATAGDSTQGAASAAAQPAGDADSTHEQTGAEDNDGPDEDSNEGPDQPITGPDLERASAAALEYLGEGRVTATEIEDEESYHEVEVTLDDGRQIDVQLDEAFNVVGTD